MLNKRFSAVVHALATLAHFVRSGDDLQDSSEPQEEKRELAYLERTDSKSETLGLTVAESKVIESRLRSSHWRNPRWSSLVVTASDGK